MKVYITQPIPEVAEKMLRDAGHEVDVNPENKILSKTELVEVLKAKPYDAVLCLLTNQIDAEIFDACPTAKIFANYAVGYNNIDVAEADKRGIVVTNTPGALTDAVAEHTVALMMSVVRRVVEADKYLREGKFKGWEPLGFLGTELKGKTVGILGAGRIGYRVGQILHKGFDMLVAYYDVKRNNEFEKELGAIFYESPEELLKVSDIVSVHVPLLDSTKHLINAERLKMMKKSAYLVNTSRGPVVDEVALVEALQNKTIAGAGLDVFENEPVLAPGLADLPNIVITPHIASATVPAREGMAVLAAQNIIDFFEGKTSLNKIVV
ncbi:MAG: D-glycerate dehydrogenase [Candidatus Zambryskibacteria bacterium]|nr:D-glycerate dehydrogenase [Candidatus Zambryskibacteria bacterium]